MDVSFQFRLKIKQSLLLLLKMVLNRQAGRSNVFTNRLNESLNF